MLIAGSVQLGLLYAIMAMGIYITFRILDLPDLTVDGSFVLGMAVSAVITAKGHPFLALLAGMAAGALAGMATGILQTKIKINAILSGILVMTSLYTINLAVMAGKANITLIGTRSVFTGVEEWFKEMMYRNRTKGMGEISPETHKAVMREIQKYLAEFSPNRTLVAAGFALLVFIVLAVFFKTKTGLAIRATGDNEDMVRSSSINADLMKCVGLAIGNACVALSGALICQYQMFSDVNSGSGMVVTGLASVIIGETLLTKRKVTYNLFTVIAGSVIYRLIIAQALKYNIFPAYVLKLVSSVIVTVALAIPAFMLYIKQGRRRRGARSRFQ